MRDPILGEDQALYIIYWDLASDYERDPDPEVRIKGNMNTAFLNNHLNI